MLESKGRKRSPEETASPISKLCFWWMFNLFRKGMKRDLETGDVYEPLKSDESEYLGDLLEREWDVELKKLQTMKYTIGKDGKKTVIDSTAPDLLRAIVRTFWWQYLSLGLLLGVGAIVVRMGQPIFQRLIVGYFSREHETSKEDAFSYATGLVIASLMFVAVNHYAGARGSVVAMRLRVACCTLVYRKILRLNKAALNNTTPGQIINLLSNDVGRFDTLSIFFNYIWIAPCQVLVFGVFMWQTIGVVSLVGLASTLIFIVPVHVLLIKYTRHLRGCIAVRTDRRIQLMSELISGIQVVKMYAWEKPFERVVIDARISEMRMIRRAAYLRALYFGMMLVSDKIALFPTIVTYFFLGIPLNADIIFPLITYYNIVQCGTGFFFSQSLLQISEVVVSIERLQTFLLLDEVDKENMLKMEENLKTERKSSSTKKLKDTDPIKEAQREADDCKERTNQKKISEPVAIEIHKLCANWVMGQLPPILSEISLKIEGGNLCTLVGPVASGKTALLNVIMGELPFGSGTVRIGQHLNFSLTNQQKRGLIVDHTNLRISYASQEPWLFSGTVRENILFGQSFCAERYEEVTKVCALNRDIRHWPGGDQTIIGENGITLSGGQKARVNLARAVYREADLYLLDDPLSAVDTRVARHLFANCINGYLRGKTRILVTHQVQFIRSADIIVVLDRGMVKTRGRFEELTAKSLEFRELLDQLKTEEKPRVINEKSNLKSTSSLKKDLVNESTGNKGSQIPAEESSDGSDAEEIPPDVSNIDAEVASKGCISSRIYMEYLKSCGSSFVIFLLLFVLTLAQVLNSLSDYWVSYWTNLDSVRTNLSDQNTASLYSSMSNNSVFNYFDMLDSDGLLSTSSAVDTYTALTICAVVFDFGRAVFYMHVSTIISQNLHNKMFTRILYATLRFFSANPSGRILNRFSKDVGTMDEVLPKVILEAVRLLLLMTSIMLMVTILNPWMILPLIFVGTFFYYARLYYLRTSQSIRRLEGINKSPVFSQVKATLNGLTTIRSSGSDVVSGMRKKFDKLQDDHTGTCYLSIMAAYTFGFYLDVASCVFIGSVCFSFIILDDGNTFGGSVGLALSQALLMTGALQYGAKQSAEAMSLMTVVERIIQYTDLPTEGPLKSADPPPPTWPTEGRITLKNVFLRYRNSDIPVLKNLCVSIEPGWKVGVVGRTGAGKSSLISALFRLENEGLEGSIVVDDRDTSNLGLHELRSKISIIPQEPVLFTGSLRDNLDPFHCYTDENLWYTLKEVELDELSLEQMVMEGGGNFSVGQRQLICLARAILKDNRILVLDEATANIDSRTDSLIQKTLRTKFARHTVITVAHRLNTVIDSDRILVMNCGQVVEFGCPNMLLRESSNGFFSQMVSQAGSTTTESLAAAAREACLRNPKHDCEQNNR